MNERKLKKWRVHMGVDGKLVTVTLNSFNEQEAKEQSQALLRKGVDFHAVVAIQEEG